MCAAASDAPGSLNPTEALIAQVWSRCLGRPIASADASFVHSGGSSLLALRVAAELTQASGRRVGPVDLLRHPRLGDLALWLASAPAADAQPALAGGEVELSASMASLVRASALDPGGSAYLVQTALRLPAALRPAALRRAFEQLAQRHPLLRCAVQLQGEQLRARLRPALPAGWWREHPRVAAGAAWPSAAVYRPLDLAADGPMRVDLWPLAAGGAVCVWTVHHFAVDEAAIDQALLELDQLLRGRTLPPVYGSPFAFAALERAGVDPAGLRAQAAQAAAVLAGQPLPLPAPPRPGGELPLALPPALPPALRDACARWGCTPFTPLLVACGLALQQVFGAAWRFVLTPFSRRSEPELLEPVGYLLDLRLVEAGARPGEALAATLARVHAALLAAQPPRWQPLDELARAADALAPGCAAGLTQFALTWRVDPLRTRHLGGAAVQPLPLPQRDARFGLVLHLAQGPQGIGASIEAVAEALADGRARSFGEAFAVQLARVCALAGQPLADRAAGAAAPDEPAGAAARSAEPAAATLAAPAAATLAADAQLVAAARAAWGACLGRAPAGDDSHFLREGGSSLQALRLAATLRRDAGLVLDLGRFLARPTFGLLCALLARRSADRLTRLTLLGPHDAARVWLLLPGMMASAASMFELAQALRAALDEGSAVAIANTDAMLALSPQPPRLAALTARLRQAVRDLGEQRLAGIAGHSVGGVLGLQLLQALGPDARAAAAVAARHLRAGQHPAAPPLARAADAAERAAPPGDGAAAAGAAAAAHPHRAAGAARPEHRRAAPGLGGAARRAGRLAAGRRRRARVADPVAPDRARGRCVAPRAQQRLRPAALRIAAGADLRLRPPGAAHRPGAAGGGTDRRALGCAR